MGVSTMSFMRQFKDNYYADDVSVELFPSHDDPEYIQVADPITLASFVAFCSRSDRQVFLRGGTDNYRNSVPSLFRDTLGMQCSMIECERRWRAYRCLLTRLRGELSGTRWTDSDDLGAVLQHYGVKTPWLDVVRNLYTAIWFATHDLETRGSCRVARWSERQYGWISFYQRDGVNNLEVCDLWGEHSSRYIRPHAQQGLSLAMPRDPEASDKSGLAPEQDFKRYRVAQIRFPNTGAWKVRGHMFSVGFLFPAPERDGSLRKLDRPVVQDIIDSVCHEHSLDKGTLGHVTHYM